MVLGWFWDRFGIVLGSFWDDFVQVPGPGPGPGPGSRARTLGPGPGPGPRARVPGPNLKKGKIQNRLAPYNNLHGASGMRGSIRLGEAL